MKNIVSLILLGLITLCCSCAPKSDIDRISKNLGDFQYLGLAPHVKVRVLKQEVMKPESKYASAKLKVTGVIQQDGEFPVKRYWVDVWFSVKLGDKEVGISRVNATIEGNTGAFSEDIYLNLPEGAEPKVDALKLELTGFGWSPLVDRRDNAVLEITN